MAVLAPALGGNYLWDDVALVRDNPLVHGFSHWPAWFSRSLFATRLDAMEQTGGVQYFRPFVLLSFATDNWLSSGNPTVGHATNLLLYAAVILGVYATLVRWQGATLGAFIASAWFALHPTHVESAAWISGRTDLLALLGLLLASYGVARRLSRRPGGLAFELLGTVVAYGSKEIAIVLPAFYAVEAWVAFGRPSLGIATLRRIFGYALPQLGISTLYLVARSYFLPFWASTNLNESLIPIEMRVGMFLETCGRAVSLTVFPWPLRGQHGLISVNAAGRLEFAPFYVTLGAASVLSLLTLLVGLYKRLPAAAIALFVLAITFAPVSNLAPSRLQCWLFERYLVIPHLAMGWLVAQTADAALKRTRNVAYTFGVNGLAFATITVFAWLVHERALDFADNERFWTHELKYNRLSSVAASNLGDLPQNANSPSKVVRYLSRCYANAAARRQHPDANKCLFRALVVLGQRTPDAQVPLLRAVINELSLLLTGESGFMERPAVKSKLGKFKLAFAPSQVKQLTTSYPGQIEAELALIQSRLGDGTLAIKYAERSLARCSGCRWTAPLSLVYAASGDYTKARSILDSVRAQMGSLEVQTFEARLDNSESAYRTTKSAIGPALIHARAERLLFLAHYGQAYALLFPETQHFLELRELAIGYAQIAYFAGYDAEARTALGRHLTPTQVAETLEQWNEEYPLIR